MRRIALLLLLAGCPKPKPPPPPPGAATCATFCDRARVLGCPEGRPTPEDASCEAVCQNAQDSGYVRLDLKCRTAAVSCAAMDECE